MFLSGCSWDGGSRKSLRRECEGIKCAHQVSGPQRPFRNLHREAKGACQVHVPCKTWKAVSGAEEDISEKRTAFNAVCGGLYLVCLFVFLIFLVS